MDSLIDERCILRKSDSMDDWWLVERAEHDGRHWLKPRDGYLALMYSGRISDADIEGTGYEMLAIAEAIERRSAVSFRRCAVFTHDHGVALESPRNSQRPALITHERARELAADIRAKLSSAVR